MVAPAIRGVALLGLSFTGTLWLALPLVAVVCFAVMVQMGASNTIVQTIVDEDKRGRVMSLFVMAFMGMSPLGSLLAGFLASHYGTANALAVGGLVCVAGSILFSLQYPRLRAVVRPIYRTMGILPEMPSAVYPAVAPPSPLAQQTTEEKPVPS